MKAGGTVLLLFTADSQGMMMESVPRIVAPIHSDSNDGTNSSSSSSSNIPR